MAVEESANRVNARDGERISCEESAVTERFIQILDMSARQLADDELEQKVTPLVGVVRKIYDMAPDGVRANIRGQLLPAGQDREKVLGRGDSLPSILLQNSTNPSTPQLREATSHLLFDMSDKDASKFVENVGYGFASGFLFQNGLPVPETASKPFTTVSAENAKRAVNPITGQFIDTEKFADMPEMSQEEKEREAERLFVLFERQDPRFDITHSLKY